MPAPLGDSLPSSSAAASLSAINNTTLPLYELRPINRDDRHATSSASPKRPTSSRSQADAPEHAHLLYASDLSADEDSPSSTTSASMPRRKARSPNPIRTSGDDTNGHATGGNASDMDSFQQHRRKRASLDSPASASQLMSGHSFSLDDEPKLSLEPEGKAKGFWELPEQDRRNFLVLLLLYLLQGVPMGLAGSTLPFLMKPHMEYGLIGVFTLASYPYSLKLLWSPIVDAVYNPSVGRRKSWIIPIQFLSGIGMIWLGSSVQQMIIDVGKSKGDGIWGFTWWWFALVFLCATQDIAVDGWALTLLSPENITYASTAQSVGLTAGHFLSYTVFLAFNSPDFANRWFRSVPLAEGLISLKGYMTFWGWAYLIITVLLAIMKKEKKNKDTEGIWEVYQVMGGVLKLRNIQIFVIIHLIAKIGFQANDAVTNLKLIEKGFSQEDLALMVLIDFPFEIGLGYYVGKWSQAYPPMQLWCWAFMGRLAAAACAQGVVMMFPHTAAAAHGNVGIVYLIVVIIQNIFSTFMSTVMFVAISAFHAKIADPVIGGTYMTLLATVSNLGGTFPRYFVLKFVDLFTSATCVPPSDPSLAKVADGASPLTSAFSCVLAADKKRCAAGGGTCNVSVDGYYIVNIMCVAFGVITFWGFIKPQALKLQALPLRAWRLSDWAGTER